MELAHRHLDRLTGGQAMYDAVSGDRGWAGLLERYRERAPGGVG